MDTAMDKSFIPPSVFENVYSGEASIEVRKGVKGEHSKDFVLVIDGTTIGEFDTYTESLEVAIKFVNFVG